MIRLVTNSALSGQLLQAVLSGAVSANQPEATVFYFDMPPKDTASIDGQHGTPYQVALNGNTDVTIASPPGAATTGTTGVAGYVRMIDYVGIYNKDTASITLTIKIDDAGTEKILWKGTLLTLEAVYYEDGRGWYAVDANGNTKQVTGSLFSSLTVTGLVDISASGAGQIKFPATQNPSSDANTLDDYEEGTWTPTDASGATLTFTTPTGSYEKIGRQFRAGCNLTYPVTADGSNTLIGGLPFTVSNNNYARQGFVGDTSEATCAHVLPTNNGTTFSLVGTAGAAITNATMSTDVLFATVLTHV